MVAMNKKSGIAVVVVLFFAFSIATIFFFMAHSNTNLAYQNKQTIYQMQAYYLAHSGMQHAKLQLRLLPKETYEFFSAGGSTNVLVDVDSSQHIPIAMGAFKNQQASYDLFKEGKAPDNTFPYGGKYHVESIELTGSHNRMKMIQDGYRVVVKAEVDSGPTKTFSTDLTEEMIVSRFTGGIN
ncbi:MAG: hypothetical protein A2W80_17595 [Candidatus Riflebacteria bacterium GWC2_50_8]|nr:MAG: hypothetical protein A2W80_17595 [Candidatus Riflebacteria bacterium GWC2_50_8]